MRILTVTNQKGGVGKTALAQESGDAEQLFYKARQWRQLCGGLVS